MSCCCGCILSKIINLIIIYGYPAYKVMKTAKEGKSEKIWIVYFLIIGLLYVLEGTLLFPLIFILGKICKRIYPTFKILFHLWLYYPEYRGALLLDQQFGKFIDLAFLKINPLLGKLFTILGVPPRDTAAEQKKNE
jgi:hypothetical protein